MWEEVNAHTIVVLFACGAAMLALWLLVRFPSFGPRSLRASLIASVICVVAEQPLLSLLEAVRNSSGGGIALLFVGLPLLTMLFWSSGCLVRAAAAGRNR
ncbi:MAG TPA: hypothetical protein VGH82_02925 [Gaiellaceae bacterium]